MVDPRGKGARGENYFKDLLVKHTGLGWRRTPGSGALDPQHKLKGDLYIPEYPLRFCVEAKNYADDHLTSEVLTGKNPMLVQWWAQAVRQGHQVDKEPLLLFKFNRSKPFAALPLHIDMQVERAMVILTPEYDFQVALAEEWLTKTQIKWSK